MEKILVTGATGKISSLLIPRLAAYENIFVRAFARNAEQIARIKQDNVEFVSGSFENAIQIRAAVKDIDAVVLITSANPNAARQAEVVLKAAMEFGVRKIIRVSVFKAAVDGPTNITRLHGETDKQIQSSGITYTILRPGFFMQNLLFLAGQSLATEDRLYFGTGAGKFGLIDLRDIVDCIEEIAVSGSYDNEILTLTGPESISFHDIADRLSVILERPIDYIPITPAAVEQTSKAKGVGSWYAEVLRQLCEQYAKNWGYMTTNNVERITGHAPRSFDTFASEILAPALKLLPN